MVGFPPNLGEIAGGAFLSKEGSAAPAIALHPSHGFAPRKVPGRAMPCGTGRKWRLPRGKKAGKTQVFWL